MTTVRASGGGVIHFPHALITDSSSVIEPPPSDALPGIAEAVHPAELLVFSKRLVQAAHKRNRNPRWEKVNRSRLVLARLCLDRALGLELRHAEAEAAETDEAMSEPDALDLVAESFHTFGEAAARALADRLGVAFETCGEAIERLERRPH